MINVIEKRVPRKVTFKQLECGCAFRLVDAQSGALWLKVDAAQAFNFNACALAMLSDDDRCVPVLSATLTVEEGE
jgi:hypothetical protein